MDWENIRLYRLDTNKSILPFDCGDSDLNEFLLNDALIYTQSLIAVTYIFENTKNQNTVAFFSVINDKISAEQTNNSGWKKFRKSIPEKKRFKSYPAVKIGRLGVAIQYQNQGLGSDILNYIKGLFLDSNKTGCRFVTVDAYNNKETLSFYEKNGFIYLTQSDTNEDTRLMYFDLITIV
ncbi:GNAT family N-acetyltransferase [Leptospira sp. mixed culture ATI2-C-A1]|nr:GNAT family N-acetyltransferase [Leptospira sp. mixed culture ATI2-C-A1]